MTKQEHKIEVENQIRKMLPKYNIHGTGIMPITEEGVDALVALFEKEKNGEGVSKMVDTFRKTYTPLDDEQKNQMAEVKDKAQELWDLLEKFVPQTERSERARLVNIGRTDLEKAVTMIVKGITTAKA